MCFETIPLKHWSTRTILVPRARRFLASYKLSQVALETRMHTYQLRGMATRYGQYRVTWSDFLDMVTSLQSWTKRLGTVLQNSYFSVISRFPLKTVHTFQNFLAVLPPPPHTIQSWNSEKILDTRVQHCLWGEGRGWTWVNWKKPQKRESVPRIQNILQTLL